MFDSSRNAVESLGENLVENLGKSPPERREGPRAIGPVTGCPPRASEWSVVPCLARRRAPPTPRGALSPTPRFRVSPRRAVPLRPLFALRRAAGHAEPS
jgi:hypothetical protein